MSNYSQLGSGGNGTDGTTGGVFDSIGMSAWPQSTAENNVQLKAKAGTADKLSVGMSANTFSSTITVTFRKNTAAGNGTVTSSGNGQFVDSTHSDTIADNDLINTKSVGASGVAYSATIITIGLRYDHTAAFTTYWSNGANGAIESYTTTTTSWAPVAGGILNGFITSGEADVQAEIRAAGTWDDLSFFSVSNSKAGNTTFQSRIGSANGNQTLTITSSGTGLFEDTTHTDSLSSGNLVNTQISTATSGTVTGRPHSRMVSSGSLQDWIAQDHRTANNGASAVRFWTIYGLVTNDATETNIYTTMQFGGTGQKLRQYVSQNATAAGWTLSLSIAAGGAGSQAVAAGTGTGWTEDATHSDAWTSGQTLTYKTTGSSNGTSLTQAIMMTQGPTSSGETGTTSMSFAGITFSASGTAKHSGTAVLTFAGISFTGAGIRNETGTASLSFTGFHYSASASRTETGTAVMSFAGFHYSATGSDIHVKGTAGMTFAGISILAAGADLGTAGSGGLRQFSTFG